MTLIDAAEFQAPPTSAQFAKAGVWEKAWRIDARQPPGPADLAADLPAYLADATDLAFEAFFGPAFFGLRLTGPRTALEPFALQCLQALHAARAGGFMAVMQRRFQLPAPDARPAFAEIGCVNAWKSIGALRIPDPAAALARFEDTWHALRQQPLFHDTRHAKAIEFAGDHPLPHWFALPISRPEAPFDISAALLRRALHAACEAPADRAGLIKAR